MYKRRVPKNAIVLKGLIFKLGIRTVVGRVVEQNGAVCFASDKEQMYCVLPFRVQEEDLNRDVTAWVRTYDNSLVFNLGDDDLLLERFDENVHYFDVVDLDSLEELFERCLIRVVPTLMSCIRYAVGSALFAFIGVLLHLPVFPFIVIPGSLAIYDVIWAVHEIRMLNNRTVYDATGNWINLCNGVTSLNRGTFQFDIKEK